MRSVLPFVALAALVLSAPTTAFAQTPHRHHAWAHTWARGGHRVARYARPFHIPRFDQAEAEDFVHTTYPYRTGLYVPWPDAYAAPYPYYAYPYGAPYAY